MRSSRLIWFLLNFLIIISSFFKNNASVICGWPENPKLSFSHLIMLTKSIKTKSKFFKSDLISSNNGWPSLSWWNEHSTSSPKTFNSVLLDPFKISNSEPSVSIFIKFGCVNFTISVSRVLEIKVSSDIISNLSLSEKFFKWSKLGL